MHLSRETEPRLLEMHVHVPVEPFSHHLLIVTERYHLRMLRLAVETAVTLWRKAFR
jgi:hypothetical protein